MQLSDRWVGLVLAVLALAVLWTARSFPPVPGQKLGSAFLPMLIGAGLLVCAVGLMVRSLRARTPDAMADDAVPQRVPEHFGSAAVIVGAVVVYIAGAERIGFLILAPLCLLAVFRALRVTWGASVLWAIGGTLVVHLAFYKLLRVPLPWGPLTPFY